MKLAHAALEPVRYRLRQDLRTQRGPIAERAGLRLTLYTDAAERGRGEALPLPDAGTESPDACARALEALVGALRGAELELASLTDTLCAIAPAAPAARCAFDTALHELAARRAGQSVAALLGARAGAEVCVNAVVGTGEPAAVAAAALAALERGFGTLKIKVGAAALGGDRERIAAARAAAPSLRLRIDANGAWSTPDALAALELLAPLDVELVEQPVAACNLEGLRRVHRESRMRVAADESLALAEGRAALLAGELASFAVLKPMVLGGLGPAAALARAAAARGIRSLVTTTFEGPLGTAAALHLAAAVGSAAHAHGLAAHDAVDAAFPAELRARDGRLRVPVGTGLTCEVAR